MMEEGRGPWGMARVMPHDTIWLVRRCMISTSVSAGGPNARTIAPYSPSSPSFPGRSPS